MLRSQLRVALVLTVLGAVAAGCHRTSDSDAAARLRSDQATAEAEEKAQEASLTSATLAAKDEVREAGEEAQRARGEMVAAFLLEQSDYRGRLQQALDLLDGEVTRARRAGEAQSTRAGDLRSRRALLKSDLLSVDRSTEQDWATLRTKVERDLEVDKPGAQLPPRTDRVSGEAP